jgi:two-component system response regulator MprA
VPVRILVVDDDRAVRESLRRSLSFNGYSVELAQDGREALDRIATDRPDALVLDVMMPRLDGLEVCRRLRGSGDELPILVLTARDAVSERVAGTPAPTTTCPSRSRWRNCSRGCGRCCVAPHPTTPRIRPR